MDKLSKEDIAYVVNLLSIRSSALDQVVSMHHEEKSLCNIAEDEKQRCSEIKNKLTEEAE